MENKNDLKNRTITIERTFNAPVAMVWNAWTQPEHIARWWAPKGMELNVIEHSFKPGGHWKYTMTMPDGKEFITEGVYAEITERRKIVTSADFRPMTEGVILEVFFTDLGDKTGFIFNVIHPTEEYCRQQEKMGIYNGWGSAFERLEDIL